MTRCNGTRPPDFPNQAMAELGHELGNVLNGLLGMTRLVSETALTAEQEQWLRAIEQSGQQMLTLIRAFRLRPGPHVPDAAERPRSRVDGIELLEQVVLSHAPSAANRGNRMLLIVDPALPRSWRCDPCRLRQLLDNLLGNAIKFTHRGDVHLEATVPRHNGLPADTLVLAVTDTGPGICPELADRMFGAYQRGSEHVRDGPDGAGLGLYICRRIARALGGEILWAAPPAGGTRFEVRLPGVLVPGLAPFRPPSRVLASVSCELDLSGPLLRSVAGCLTRLGISWRLGGEAAQGNATRISIIEVEAGGSHPGPGIALVPAEGGGECRTISGPVLESTLGPVLLELAMNGLWVRNERRGSVAGQCRSARRGGPGPRRE